MTNETNTFTLPHMMRGNYSAVSFDVFLLCVLLNFKLLRTKTRQHPVG